ncbi:MAG: amidohydrolase family protein, partial [Deltaproteobacteria bacterium]|nr:amidohydrolase family protein [Deltaproteobacteria bacterium]
MNTNQTTVKAFVGGTLIDGNGGDPVSNAAVVVIGSAIESAGAKDQIAIPEGAQVFDVSGKTLMPGMFDCHAHLTIASPSIEKMLFTHRTYAAFKTAEIMKRTLHAGFTTVRDAGGMDVGFRQAVVDGLIEGPRMVISGMLGQTGGHADWYFPSGAQPLKDMMLDNIIICDGLPDVQKGARKLLRLGIDFIKICATGGVTSPADAPEYTEWTPEELAAIVYEAKARNREVMAHAEGTQGIKNAVRAGIWSIEHGAMLDDEAIDMMLEAGTYLVPTLFVVEDIFSRGAE